MSHQPQRKDKDCLNCEATVHGRFCHQCGQENVVTHQSFWSLTKHFVYDVLHFDGRFFETLKGLLVKPGFVPKQYVSGKRHAYLDPIRMYLFTSAIFFLVFFSVAKIDKAMEGFPEIKTLEGKERLEQAGMVYNRILKGDTTSSLHKQLQLLTDTSYDIRLIQSANTPDNDSKFRTVFRDTAYLMVAKKSKVPDSLNLDVGMNWLNRRFEKKIEKSREKNGNDTKAMIQDFLNSFLHKFPYILFVSLPFFALILKLVYMRQKRIFYSDHAVFTLYHYIISFILMLLFFLFRWLNYVSHFGIFTALSTITFLAGGVYLFIGMKRFYEQSWGKTTIKFLVLNGLAFIMLGLLMFLFILLSVIEL